MWWDLPTGSVWLPLYEDERLQENGRSLLDRLTRMDGSEAWLRKVRERKRGGPEGTAPHPAFFARGQGSPLLTPEPQFSRIARRIFCLQASRFLAVRLVERRAILGVKSRQINWIAYYLTTPIQGVAPSAGQRTLIPAQSHRCLSPA